jgi:ABC-type multidrug transport system ATPase subunit
MSIQVKIFPNPIKQLAVASVSFDVKEGEIFGLIGPDGAGKQRFSGY